MQDARYLRSQAELCLQMAHKVSDERVAANLRAATPPTTFPALPRLKAKEQVLTRNTRKRDFDLHGNEYTQDDEIPFSLIVMTKRFEDQSWYREWKVTMDRVVTARMALDTIKPDAPERPPADREYEAALAAFRLLAEKHR